jgi:hypothetical protein
MKNVVLAQNCRTSWPILTANTFCVIEENKKWTSFMEWERKWTKKGGRNINEWMDKNGKWKWEEHWFGAKLIN